MTCVTANGYFDAEDSEQVRFEKRKALNTQRTNAARLPSPQSELQQRLEHGIFAFLPEYANPAIQQRDWLRRAAGAWRKGALPLFQRDGLQQADRGQQGITHHTRCKPHRPLRSDGRVPI